MDSGKMNAFDGPRQTLHGLREQQHTLSMRLLLALRLRDGAAQAALEAQLAALQEEIARFTLRTRPR